MTGLRRFNVTYQKISGRTWKPIHLCEEIQAGALKEAVDIAEKRAEFWGWVVEAVEEAPP